MALSREAPCVAVVPLARPFGLRQPSAEVKLRLCRTTPLSRGPCDRI